MAQLPPDGEWLVQKIDDKVHVFNQYTSEIIVKFDPTNADETAKLQAEIHYSHLLTDEQKAFAHFWCGYFYAHSN